MVNLEEGEKMMTATEHIVPDVFSSQLQPLSVHVQCPVWMIYKPVTLMVRSAGMARRLAGSQLGAAIKAERRVCSKTDSHDVFDTAILSPLPFLHLLPCEK